MLFASYGAPAPPRGKNPLVIILGVCGGCVLLIVIGVVIFGVFIGQKVGGIMGGAMRVPVTTQSFVRALESHNYTAAAALVDPSAKSTLNAATIKAMEDQAEKKLGPIQKVAYSPGQPMQKVVPGSNGALQSMELTYQIPLRFQKGDATATITFASAPGGDGALSGAKLSGLVTGFKLHPDSQ
jgi:hypothetical protein